MYRPSIRHIFQPTGSTSQRSSSRTIEDMRMYDCMCFVVRSFVHTSTDGLCPIRPILPESYARMNVCISTCMQSDAVYSLKELL
jgi:hypothetical protein